MKKLILMLAIGASAFSAYAQKTVKVEKVQQETEVTAIETEKNGDEEEPRKRPSTGDLYEGLTRTVTFDRMIPPYGL